MATVREAAMVNLFALITTALASMDVVVLRNEALDEKVDEESGIVAVVNLLDGNKIQDSIQAMGGTWEHLFGPQLQMAVRGNDTVARDELYNDVLVAISDAVDADTTLSGVVDLCLVDADEGADPEMLSGAVGFKTGVLPFQLLFTSNRSIG